MSKISGWGLSSGRELADRLPAKGENSLTISQPERGELADPPLAGGGKLADHLPARGENSLTISHPRERTH